MDSIIKIGFWEKAFKSLRLALAKVGLAEDEWGYSDFHEDLGRPLILMAILGLTTIV